VNDIKLDYKNSVYLISYWKNVRFDLSLTLTSDLTFL